MENINNYPTDGQLAKYLDKQIDAKLEKTFDQQDMDYIDECIAFQCELSLSKDLPDPAVKNLKICALNFRK